MLLRCLRSRRLLDAIISARRGNGRWLCRLDLRVLFGLSSQAERDIITQLGALVEATNSRRKRGFSLLLALLGLFICYLEQLLLLLLGNFLVECRVQGVRLSSTMRHKVGGTTGDHGAY